MNSRFKYYRVKEIFVLFLGSIFNRILLKLQYQKKYLTIRNEINDLLKENINFLRKEDNILVINQNKDHQKYLLRLLTSDKAVFHQVIVKNEYLPIVKLIEEKSTNKSIKFIIDAGSNIGLTSIYFKSLFPSAIVISIEPEESNYFHQLKNIKINNLDKTVFVLRKALWKNNTDNLSICNDFRDGRNWSKSVKLFKRGDVDIVQSITLPDLILQYSPIKIVDLLKIDIEGSEKDLFESMEFVETISRSVRFLCLEIHDEYNIRNSIRKVLAENNFEIFEEDETTFCYNKNLN